MNFMLDYLRPSDVFIDVGANVGVYSLLASVTPGVSVWAFEPSSYTLERIKANVALNGLESRIEVVQAAIGAARGTALLTVGLGAVNQLVSEGESRSVESVRMVTLDEYLPDEAKDQVGLIKIDVEGEEAAVLEGASDLISAALPALIIEANDPDRVRASLAPLGYRPFTYAPATKTLSEASWGPSPTGNILALADVDRANERVAFPGSQSRACGRAPSVRKRWMLWAGGITQSVERNPDLSRYQGLKSRQQFLGVVSASATRSARFRLFCFLAR
jgi:FkbM family methyltransferase